MAGSRLTETHVAASVVRRLVEQRVIPNDPHILRRTLTCLGLTADDMHAAAERAGGKWVPLDRQPVLGVAPTQRPAGRVRDTAPKAGRTAAKDYSYIPLTGVVPRLEGEPATKTCTGCGVSLPIDAYRRTSAGATRADGTRRYRRYSRCDDCRRKAARARYISIERRDGLAAVGVQWVAEDEALTCVCCGQIIEAGQHALGVGVVLHAACRNDLPAELAGEVRQIPSREG
jgi:hypothetical protein